jgi:ppGpp synthetase/RelA/SpoT-type nucleotidyltranferase
MRASLVSLIDEFLEHYNREFDYYAEVARIVQQQLEATLLSHGIRAMVTSRAKRPDRLRDKLIKRNREKEYLGFNDIYEDVIDLAGVRVALYFPGDRERVGVLIDELFEPVRKPKTFPESKKTRPGKRFMGYVATHYLIRLKPETLEDTKSRYAETVVEIQVASVLMHAWAEVDHDLVYKPETGDLSDDELAILDEINGLVLTGEIALERLQKAIQRRTGKDDFNFKDQFELASYLAQRAAKLKMQTADIGKVDVLFEVLRYVHQDTPKKLSKYIAQIEGEDKARSIADVVLDKVLAGQPKLKAQRLSELISRILSRGPFGGSTEGGEAETATGFFLTQWIKLETTIRRLVPGERLRLLPVRHAVRQLQLPANTRVAIERLNRLRNELVHGIERPTVATLNEAGAAIRDSILPQLQKIASKAR